MGQVCLSEPKLSSKGSQEMTTSKKRSMGRHLVSHLLRGQNEGSTPIWEKKISFKNGFSTQTHRICLKAKTFPIW